MKKVIVYLHGDELKTKDDVHLGYIGTNILEEVEEKANIENLMALGASTEDLLKLKVSGII